MVQSILICLLWLIPMFCFALIYEKLENFRPIKFIHKVYNINSYPFGGSNFCLLPQLWYNEANNPNFKYKGVVIRWALWHFGIEREIKESKTRED